MIRPTAALIAVLFVTPVPAAFAHTATPGVSPSSSASNAARIEALFRGQGQPGDVIRSVSNPDVVFTVMENGTVQRRNERYDTVDYRRPLLPGERDPNHSGK
jgi:hypothetical protein